jgi:hypothetical protein
MEVALLLIEISLEFPNFHQFGIVPRPEPEVNMSLKRKASALNALARHVDASFIAVASRLEADICVGV